MPLFKSGTFLSKLTRVELEKYSQKKGIVCTSYLHKILSIADLVKIIKVSTPPLRGLLDELKAEHIKKTREADSSKGVRRPTLYGLSRKVFYILSTDTGKHSTRFTLFDSTNKIGNDFLRFIVTTQFAYL